jgi:hypothetical protein
MDSKTARIRALNDELRQNFAGGAAVMTPGIAALGADAVARIVKTVAVFDDFCHANDPHVARSRPMASGCSSRSTTSMRASRTTPRTRLIRRSPSA